jgi:hypothetical protein
MQLFNDLAHVVLYGSLGKKQFHSYLLIGQSLRDKGQYLNLPG